MNALGTFFKLEKVDAQKRLVYGVATAEAPDRSGEICDYATTKPYYEAWSADFAKASNGKSLGNVRAMHSKIAAGRVEAINFDDDAKRIEIVAKVIDDAEWKKVVEGVYTGFSQGGEYVKRWKDEADPTLQRYTANPTEVSLVDLPCLPDSTFKMVKADGLVEDVAFQPPAEVVKAEAPPVSDGVEQGWRAKDGQFFAKKADALAHNIETDLADLAEREEMAKGDMEDGAKAAATLHRSSAAVHQSRAAVHEARAVREDASPEIARAHRRAAEAHGMAAEAHLGAAKAHEGAMTRAARATASDATEKAIAADVHSEKQTTLAMSVDKAFARDELAKWLGEEACDAAQALYAVQTLFNLLSVELAEDENEPGQVAALRDAIQRLKDFIVSEIQEDTSGDALAMAAKSRLQKSAAHTAAKETELAKAALVEQVELLKAASEKRETEFEAKFADLAKRIEEIGKQPLPPPHVPGTRVAEKGGSPEPENTEKAIAEKLAGMSQDEIAAFVIKHAQTQPIPMRIARG